MISWILIAAFLLFSAKLRTFLATTLNIFPAASSARLASIETFRANNFVCVAI